MQNIRKYTNLFSFIEPDLVRAALFLLLFFMIPYTAFGQDNWHRLVMGDVILFCKKKDFKQGELILEDVREELPAIVHDLKLNVRGEIKIILTPNEQIFQELTGGTIPEWGVGAADKENRLIFLKASGAAGSEQSIKQVLVHELTHILVGMQLNDKALPRWFDEGLAMWTSKDARIWDQIRFSRALLTGNEVPLSDIDYVLAFQKEKAALAYWESRSAIDFIVTEYGKPALQMLLHADQDTLQWDRWFQIVTGSELFEFEKQWLQAMKKKYRWSMIVDYRLLISLFFVGMFITAYLYKRYQTRQKLMMWENDEKTLEEI